MKNEPLPGSMEVLNSLQMTAESAGLDQASKELCKNKEVLAVILKGVVKEYADYSCKEIEDFIEGDSITDEKSVTPGLTNTRIRGDGKDFLDTIKKNIDFSDNEQLWKEVNNMTGLGASVMWDGYVKGREEGWQSGRAEGREMFLQALRSLMRKHNLTAEQALEELDIPAADRAEYLAKL